MAQFFGGNKISRSDLSRSFFEINTGKISSKTTKFFRKLAKILVKIFASLFGGQFYWWESKIGKKVVFEKQPIEREPL